MGAWPLTCAVSEPSPSNSKSMSEGSGAEIAVLATGITDPKVMDAEKLEKARLSCAETTTPSQQQGSPITLRVACDRLREACELSRRELCAATSAHLPDDQQASRVSLRGGDLSLALLLESLNHVVEILRFDPPSRETEASQATNVIHSKKNSKKLIARPKSRKPALEAEALQPIEQH